MGNPVTSDQDCGLLGRTVHHRLGHARVLPAVVQLGAQYGQIPNRLLLHTGDRRQGGQRKWPWLVAWAMRHQAGPLCISVLLFVPRVVTAPSHLVPLRTSSQKTDSDGPHE